MSVHYKAPSGSVLWVAGRKKKGGGGVSARETIASWDRFQGQCSARP